MKKHVAIVIMNKDNKILFIQRSMTKKTLPGAWSFPSGTSEVGENIYETTIREAEEELGVNVGIHKTLATKELPEFSVELVFVLCSIRQGVPYIKEPYEIDKIEWLRFEEFFKRFSDNEIGHGLIWLRKNPEVWRNLE